MTDQQVQTTRSELTQEFPDDCRLVLPVDEDEVEDDSDSQDEHVDPNQGGRDVDGEHHEKAADEEERHRVD